MSSLHDTRGLGIRGLRRAFGPVPVLDGIDLHVGPSEVVLLTGTNGSGKTTLLRCVAGLVRHDGDVQIDGMQAGAARLRGDIGYLPQSPGLPTWATGAEVLDLFGRLRGASRTPSVLPDGFLPPMDRRIGHLSGGMRQRVAVAVALLGSPRVLLLDEPIASLDDDGRQGLQSILEAVRAGDTCVLVTAPSSGDLEGVVDRTVRISDGRLVPAGAETRGPGAQAVGRVHRLMPRGVGEVTP